jgi:CrcB protein
MMVLYVALGGAIGSALRYLFMIKIAPLFGINFPYGTMLINIIGSCLIGLLIGYMAKTIPHSNEFRAFAAVGILGGFTTFSAFSLDVVTMFERGEMMNAGLYIAASVVVSLLALFAGLHAVRTFL